MAQTTVECAASMTLGTLAAWRDGALAEAEAGRIAGHVAECAVCRREIRKLERMDGALRGMRAPEPDGRLWSAVRGGMVTGGGRRRGTVRWWRPRLASGLGAVAAVLLVALGFAQVLHGRTVAQETGSARATTEARAHETPTPIPPAVAAAPAVAGQALGWQQAQLPYAPLTDQDILSFAVVAGHGESAYACHAISDRDKATLTMYHTIDRGLHWTTLQQFGEPSVDVSECLVEVDALDGMRLLVQVGGQNMRTLKEVGWSELTEDGGATWTRLETTMPTTTYGLATAHGKTYALRIEQTGAQFQYTQHLSVSVDHLRSWQPVDQGIIGANSRVQTFWVSADGELLAEVTTTQSVTTTATATPASRTNSPLSQPVSAALWRSTDGGAHWAPFPAPAIQLNGRIPEYFVGVPQAGQPWQVCTTEVATGTSLACTFDSGTTWSARPWLCIATPCMSRGGYASQFTIANDGAVLTMAITDSKTNTPGIYRLPKGSNTWQYLGPVAGSNAYFFAATARGGVLWAYAGGTYQTPLSGIIGGHQMLPGILATATYP